MTLMRVMSACVSATAISAVRTVKTALIPTAVSASPSVTLTTAMSAMAMAIVSTNVILTSAKSVITVYVT